MNVGLRRPALDLLYQPERHLQIAAESTASATLLSGQGNSGAVLSFFFVRLAAELKTLGGSSTVRVTEFGSALENVGADIGSAFPPDKVKEGGCGPGCEWQSCR